MTPPSRRRVLLLPAALLLARCGGTPSVPHDYPPLRDGYLRKLRLNVAEISVENQAPDLGDADIANRAPLPPGAALARMGRERLVADGASGRAVLLIQEADLLRSPAGLVGRMRVRLDVFAQTGEPVAFAEAAVSRTAAGFADERDASYDLAKRMMADMNIEFEYQVRRSLRDWLLPDGDAPVTVKAQDLPAPASDSAPETGPDPAALPAAPMPPTP